MIYKTLEGKLKDYATLGPLKTYQLGCSTGELVM